MLHFHAATVVAVKPMNAAIQLAQAADAVMKIGIALLIHVLFLAIVIAPIKVGAITIALVRVGIVKRLEISAQDK